MAQLGTAHMRAYVHRIPSELKIDELVNRTKKNEHCEKHGAQYANFSELYDPEPARKIISCLVDEPRDEHANSKDKHQKIEIFPKCQASITRNIHHSGQHRERGLERACPERNPSKHGQWKSQRPPHEPVKRLVHVRKPFNSCPIDHD